MVVMVIITISVVIAIRFALKLNVNARKQNVSLFLNSWQFGKFNLNTLKSLK